MTQYSFYSSREGFACDSVANFEVVLGDGSIINANAKKNSDLFRSLKGGSGNFGFITRVDQCKLESPSSGPSLPWSTDEHI